VRAPLVEAEQDGSICIKDLTKVVMTRRRLGLAEERLVPFEAARNVAYADDRPCAFHHISAVGLTRIRRKLSSNSVFIEGLPIKRKHEFLIIKTGRSEQAWIPVLAYLMKMQPTRLPLQGNFQLGTVAATPSKC